MSFTGLQFEIAAGEHQVTVVEVGAALRSYRHAGVEVTCSYPDGQLPPKACGITLAPWPNRIAGGRYTFDGVEQQLILTEPSRGNASHGLGRWARWTKVEHLADRVALQLDVVPQPGYPHEVRVEVTYAVDAATGLSVTTRATNTGRSRAPFGTGAHPYLATGGRPIQDVTVRLAADTVLVTDEAQMPFARNAVAGTRHDLRGGLRLGSLRLDDAFTDIARDELGRGFVEVGAGSGGARLWFGSTYGFVQLFTVDELTPGAAGLAVEPMSCPGNAFNSGDGLVVLEPGQAWEGGWGIQPL